MSENKHTPGPWKYICEILDAGGWQIPKQFITIYTDEHIIAYYDTAGMEYPEDSVNEANARLIAAVPKLLETCEAQHNAIDILLAKIIELDSSFLPSKSGQPWEALKQGNEAIAEAKKEG